VRLCFLFSCLRGGCDPSPRASTLHGQSSASRSAAKPSASQPPPMAPKPRPPKASRQETSQSWRRLARRQRPRTAPKQAGKTQRGSTQILTKWMRPGPAPKARTIIPETLGFKAEEGATPTRESKRHPIAKSNSEQPCLIDLGRSWCGVSAALGAKRKNQPQSSLVYTPHFQRK